MKRRLLLNINAHPGYDEAADYDSAYSAKYTLDNDELWATYLAAQESYVTTFAAIRKEAKREHLTEEDMKNYEQSEED